MPYTFGPQLRERVATNLRTLPREGIDDPALRQAGVAIVIVRSESDDEASVLLTKRPESLRRHAGQYALPGGRLDTGETVEQAALRELHEELRLELGPDDILGVLDDYPTRSGFRITPVVLWGGAAPVIEPDPVEVAYVLRIPFRELDDPRVPRLRPTEDGRPPVLSAPLPTMGSEVYAPTAAMLYQFREVAIRGLTTRVSHFDQPRFAWR
ncbi:MAG: CoA pyrophosphatase [Hyphomicrobiaceae bacterium]|nr:CoA pyrophosphatase [Hyphomicrobiaceae bacterium]